MAIDNARSSRSMRQHVLHFTFNEAKKLTKKKYSSVVEVLHNMTLSMSPKFIGNINLGLKETLAKELLTYSEQLKGVPLAYNNIKIIDSEVIDDQDLFKLDVRLTFIVFKPQPGEFLDAVVNKTTDHHIGCVIHNCINSSVRQPKIDALTEEQRAVTENIEIGDTITFKVWRLDVHHGILFVLGDIIGPCYTRIGKSKERDICKMNNNKAGYSTIIDAANDSCKNETDVGSNGTIKQEPAESTVELEVVAEKSPKKKKNKKIKTDDGNADDIENMGERVIKVIEIKQEPMNDVATAVAENIVKKKKETIITTSESEGNISTPTKKKKKKKKDQEIDTPESNNDILHSIKKEPVTHETTDVDRSPKKKKEILISQNGEVKESPHKKKHKYKEKTGDLELKKKIYSSDKELMNMNLDNPVKKELIESESMKSPKKVKHKSKELIDVTNVDSPSKKKRKKDSIKEEVVSETEFSQNEHLTSSKKKKKTYTGS